MDSTSKTERLVHRVRIVDGDALRSVLQTVYAQEGSHRGAAERLGIKKYTFTRLLNGTTRRSITFDTYASIMKSLGGQALEHGRAPDPLLTFTIYPTDQKAEAAARVAANLYYVFERSILTHDSRLALDRYEAWIERELRRLEQGVRPLFEELWSHHPQGRQFKDFLQRIRDSFDLPLPEDRRCWLALFRALEPLCDAEATGGVERTWEEMDQAGELREYLKAALKREEVLMRRERDLDRIRRVPPDVVERIKADLAGAFDEEDEGAEPAALP